MGISLFKACEKPASMVGILFGHLSYPQNYPLARPNLLRGLLTGNFMNYLSDLNRLYIYPQVNELPYYYLLN